MTIDGRTLTELASVFAEVCSHHRDVQPWPDRPDLDAEVRAFWGALGLSPATAWMAPRESVAEDEELLTEVLEEWLESPYLRDRWALSAEDGSLPRHLLPPKRPRLLAGDAQVRPLILADEGEPGGKLFRFHGTGRLEPLELPYYWWCLQELLRVETRDQCGAVKLGADIALSPAVEHLDTPLLRAADGVYFLRDSPLMKPEPGWNVPYRDLGCYARFILSLPDEVKGQLFDPVGFLIACKVKKSNKLLHPEQQGAWPGFPRHLLAIGNIAPPFNERAAGLLDGHWVWVKSGALENGNLIVLTDPADEEAVVASLVTRGATITRKERLRRGISALNW